METSKLARCTRKFYKIGMLLRLIKPFQRWHGKNKSSRHIWFQYGVFDFSAVSQGGGGRGVIPPTPFRTVHFPLYLSFFYICFPLTP